MKEYSKMLKNMFKFEGRARRREYWVCGLINAAIQSIMGAIMIVGATIAGDSLYYKEESLIGFNTKGSLIATIIFLAIVCISIYLFVSMIGLTVRRYHDIGLPGWVYPICLVGSLFCGIGLIAHIIICFLPSKEDNSYGENPKKPELNEYEGVTSIILAIVFMVGALLIVRIAAFCNIHFCGYSVGNGSSIDQDTPVEITTEDTEDLWVDEEITEETESTEQGESDTEEMTTESDLDAYGDGVPSDSQMFPLKIDNVTLQLTFDPGATVYATDYSIELYKSYDNGTMFQAEYADSYSSIGDTEYLYASDFYDGVDGYTLVESKEKELLEDGSSYISYYIYQKEDGTYIVNATIWQNIGAGNYLEIKVETDGTNNIDDVIEGAIITL